MKNIEEIKKIEYPYYSLEYKFNKKKYMDEFEKYKLLGSYDKMY